MAFKLIKRNKLPVRVKGTLPGDDGKPVDFDFILHCKRLNQQEIDSVMSDKKGEVKDFVRNVAEGWERVLDADDAPAVFAVAQLDELLDNAGLPMLILQCYLKQVAAVAKN